MCDYYLKVTFENLSLATVRKQSRADLDLDETEAAWVLTCPATGSVIKSQREFGVVLSIRYFEGEAIRFC